MKHSAGGFTLIELSIVLVIIGLIVGGVLVGQDLIRSATVRAQITQIERYNTAVNTFRGKYGYLPGDIPDPDASNFGFLARGTNGGQGDGNGYIAGWSPVYGSNDGLYDGGEVSVFWVDLSTAHLIDGTFNTATPTAVPNLTTQAQIATYIPQAKIGAGNYVYVYGGCASYNSYLCKNTGINYFGLSAVNVIYQHRLDSTTGLTTAQAYNIDNKVDDGLPQAGSITAAFVDGSNGTACVVWSNAAPGSCLTLPNGTGVPYTSAVAGSSTTCFDNGGLAGTQHYSVGQGGNNLNCALSFRFQ